MKRLKGIIILMTAMVFMMIFSACTNEDVAKGNGENGADGYYPIAIEDSLGESLEIKAEPQRVIALAPNITEMLYALDLGDKVVGRNSYSDYPEEVLEVETVGDFVDLDIEKIAELQPDVVIASTFFDEDLQNKFKELGIIVITLYDENSFEGVYEGIEVLGKVFNVEEKAEEEISRIKAEVEEVQSLVKDAEKPSVYYVVDYGQSGDYTATGETFISRMIEIAGGENIAKDITGWVYSKEQLIEQDPDIILLSPYYYEGFISGEGYKELSAVKNEKVYVVDNNLLDRQGPRAGKAVEELAKILHPELYK
ncbi:ABC transporter substrate-binding protein [Alloiococcus sp. CFN-8]|uniref:ABC transporter substrate-binding protein n=1 Tax=Alloiococcus sp. CFN-8 TaxID=3416081 RepID=UPI003CF8F146